MYLSKSDYLIGLDCVKALWLKKNRKDLTPEIDEATQRRFDIGNEVQDLAREFFPGGVMLPAENWDVINGSKITADLAKSNDILYEAFIKGKMSDAEAQVLFDGLEKYCGQDIYAMVLLMDVLYKYAER